VRRADRYIARSRDRDILWHLVVAAEIAERKGKGNATLGKVDERCTVMRGASKKKTGLALNSRKGRDEAPRPSTGQVETGVSCASLRQGTKKGGGGDKRLTSARSDRGKGGADVALTEP